MYTAYIQFVRWCRGYLGKKQSISLLVLQLSLGKNLILLTFLDSNIHKHENFKLTVLHGHMFYYTLTLCW